jgi:putative hydrolase of the HAD superfamily
MASGEKPSAILFDAGGTLVLQNPVRLSEVLSREIDPVAAHRAHYVAMAEFSDLLSSGGRVTFDWWLERYFSLLGVPEPHLVGSRIERGFGFWDHPLDGIGEALERLRAQGVRIAVVSNSDGSVRDSLAKAGLGDLIELVIDSQEVGFSKPSPEIFRVALERLALEPSQVWHVGDSVFHDINGARSASIAKAVLVDPFELGPADVVRVRSVAELKI